MAAVAASLRTTGRGKRRRHSIHGREGMWGWLFVSPALAVLVVFLVVPIVLAFYVSLLKWNGLSSPFGKGATFVGAHNYRSLLTQDGLARTDFAVALRNNFYYVVGVVPAQTALALFLAVVIHQRWLKGRQFFRTAFYFPSITSSIAIALVFIYLFQNDGAINTVLRAFGVRGPSWFADSRGILHIVLGGLGVHTAPAWAQHRVFSLSLWDWLAGPSVAMSAIMLLVIWTTAGTFMLMFLAALQNISGEVEEATLVDGASPWQRFWHVTLPMLRPTLFLVLTLGVIGSWQVFDQIYVMSQGNPAKTTLTPAYLSYRNGFIDGKFGQAAAMAFLLFLLIVVVTLLQRWMIRERSPRRSRRAA